MKKEIRDIGLNSVIKIITEEIPSDRVIIQKHYISAIPGENLLLLNTNSFVTGLHFARNLLTGTPDPVIVVPAESAYDDDFSDLITNAVNNSNRIVVCFNQQVSLLGYACASTPKGAATKNFSAFGSKKGYPFFEKPLCQLLSAAGATYIAQTSAFFEDDLRSKIHKAFGLKGFRFINVLTPSPYWGYLGGDEEEIGNLALSTGHFPHFEIEKGTLSVKKKFAKLQPLTEYFGLQKRFRHLNLPENRRLLDEIQHSVQITWDMLCR